MSLDLLVLALLVYFVLATICACLGAILVTSRGYGVLGFLLGLIFGPFGVIIVLLIPPPADWEANRQLEMERARRKLLREPHCRECGYDLRWNTSGKCPECGTEIEESGVETK
jgi:hypothetical protein